MPCAFLSRSDRRRKVEKKFQCVNNLLTIVKRTEARKWILIHPFRCARRGEKLTRWETQKNLKRNSQFQLSKRYFNIICCILNIVLLFMHEHAIVLGQCAISVYICFAFSLFPLPLHLLWIHKNINYRGEKNALCISWRRGCGRDVQYKWTSRRQN